MRRVSTLALAAALASASASAQQIDMALIQKWAAAEVVRYHAEGVYHGWTNVSDKWADAEGDASDALVVDFEWNLRQRQLVGTPTFSNASSKVAGMRSASGDCPVAQLAGSYEHFTASAVDSDGQPRLTVHGARTFAATLAPLECPASQTLMPAPGHEAEAVLYLPVLDPKLLGVGTTGSPGAAIAPDKSSFVLDMDGWSWTFSPTLVR